MRLWGHPIHRDHKGRVHIRATRTLREIGFEIGLAAHKYSIMLLVELYMPRLTTEPVPAL